MAVLLSGAVPPERANRAAQTGAGCASRRLFRERPSDGDCVRGAAERGHVPQSCHTVGQSIPRGTAAASQVDSVRPAVFRFEWRGEAKAVCEVGGLRPNLVLALSGSSVRMIERRASVLVRSQPGPPGVCLLQGGIRFDTINLPPVVRRCGRFRAPAASGRVSAHFDGFHRRDPQFRCGEGATAVTTCPEPEMEETS